MTAWASTRRPNRLFQTKKNGKCFKFPLDCSARCDLPRHSAAVTTIKLFPSARAPTVDCISGSSPAQANARSARTKSDRSSGGRGPESACEWAAQPRGRWRGRWRCKPPSQRSDDRLRRCNGVGLKGVSRVSVPNNKGFKCWKTFLPWRGPDVAPK